MPFWKRRQDSQQLSAMDWYNLVAESLHEMRSSQKASLLKVKINHAQCSEAAMVFSSKLSKFWPHALPNPPFTSEESDGSSSSSSRRISIGSKSESFSSLVHSGDDASEHNPVLESCKHALKEVHRVIKELEAYFLLCSNQEWWKSALLRADNGEVLTVHIHDLLWSVAALDAAIHHAKGCSLEVIDAVCSRRRTECYAEVSSLHHQLNEATDRKQVLSMLTSLNDQFERLSWRQKRTLRVEEKIKYQVSAYLLHKLRGCINPSLSTAHHGLPDTLSIDPKDIDFSRRRLIGRGSFGQVYEASWLGMKVAVKELPCGDSQLFKEEASILAKLRSPFIVQLIGWSVHEEANVCHLVMELCDSNLRSHIEKRLNGEPPFSLRVAVDIMLQIARGMEYLHSQRVIHRDLRASNILVDHCAVRELADEGHVRVKLCDFGMAKAKRNSSKLFSSMKGSTYWRAPEVFSDTDLYESGETSRRPYTDKVDVYSFAMTCFEILTGEIPFEGTLLRKEIQHFVSNGGRPELPASCPSLLSNYIKKCWDGDDKCRPSFKDICKVLRHVKLLLQRVDDPEEVSFQSVATEFDYVELANNTHALSLGSSGGWSFNDRTTPQGCEASGEDDELQIRSGGNPSSLSRPLRSSTIHRIRSALSFNNKPMEVEPRDALFFTSLPYFITKYSLHDLRTATANFSERVSKGESVFRGVLCDDSVVAVKAVKYHSVEDIRTFCSRIVALGNAYHPNLVHFRGYCSESESHFLFVFDYMDNHSLDRWLPGDCSSSGGSSNDSDIGHVKEPVGFSWSRRLKIAIGVARGLAFLHEDGGQCILPVGLKLSKILLDKEWEPKLNSLSSTETEKNYQYFSHKVFFDKLSTKLLVMSPAAEHARRSDVYSFGIILFELAAGHATELPKTPSEEGLVPLMSRPDEFFQLLGGQSLSTSTDTRTAFGLLDIICGRSEGADFEEGDPQAVEKAKLLLQTAMWCVQDFESRPTMSQVVRTLEGNLNIPPQQLWDAFNLYL